MALWSWWLKVFGVMGEYPDVEVIEGYAGRRMVLGQIFLHNQKVIL